ncbi:MAG TPA: alpha/beta hydrolase domain-containing protein [Solimonas sp.]|nr:alpha/beta hydrolase domain-containing protein [Solimonas sp.]
MSLLRLPALAVVLLLGACGSSGTPGGTSGNPSTPGARVADATVAGPITGGLHGHPLWDSWYDLGELGYVEEEYFISGSAKTYPATTPADYTTRIIVRRPADVARFNGTVLLDWVNVTAQFENAVDTLEAHQLFHRDGYAYVHVSAQAAGLCCLPELTPKLWDPQRYAPISHPGDDYAFDMLSQIAKAIRAPTGIAPMGPLKVQRIIAMGQSQSAIRLYGYVTQVQRDADVIDGFLIHSGGGRVYDPAPAVPVIQLFSEFEASPEEPSHVVNYRAWEIAGSAHQNFWVGYHQVLGAGLRALGDLQRPASADEEMHATAANYGEQVQPLQLVCIVAGTQFPMRYLVSSAIHHLDRWIRTGVAPPEGARYQFDGNALAKDQYGNALGGIRLPMVDVPVARSNATLCTLGGITVPFTDPELMSLYPTHADYYCQTRAATQRAVEQGFLLPADAEELLGRAMGAKNRWLVEGAPEC